LSGTLRAVADERAIAHAFQRQTAERGGHDGDAESRCDKIERRDDARCVLADLGLNPASAQAAMITS
jgi:hypothetical protein